MILIPILLTCSGIHYIIFAYYTYLTSYILIKSKSPILYSHTILHIIPATSYIVIIVDYYTGSSFEYILSYYTLEWMIMTPIMLTSLSSIKKVSIPYYYILSFLTIIMNLLGYISLKYIVSYNTTIIYTFFSLGLLCYVAILYTLYIIIKYNDNTIENTEQYDVLNNNKIYKTLLLGVAFSWTFYPIIFIIYLLHYINAEICGVFFTITDLLSKSLFTTIVIGYELYKANNGSILSRITSRVAQIHPLSFPSVQVEPGQASYTLSDIPQITHTTTIAVTSD